MLYLIWNTVSLSIARYVLLSSYDWSDVHKGLWLRCRLGLKERFDTIHVYVEG